MIEFFFELCAIYFITTAKKNRLIYYMFDRLTCYTREEIYFVADESKILRGSVAASAAFCSLVNQQAIRLKYSRPDPWRELWRNSVLYSPRITKLLFTSNP